MPDLDLITRGIAIGVAGSALMDLWSAVLRRRFGVPTLDYRLLGRWIGHLARGESAAGWGRTDGATYTPAP